MNRYEIHKLQFIILFLAFISCSAMDEGPEISFFPEIFPYVDTIYANHNNIVPFYALGQIKSNKLLFYTYGDCSFCLAKIVEWQNFVKSNKELFTDVQCALIIYTEKLEILEYNLERVDNSLPIYIDSLGKFPIYNSFPVKESQMLLLDKSNTIQYSSIDLNKPEDYHFKMIIKILNKL